MKHKPLTPKPRKHKIVKGDRVRVIRGNFRDQEGTVLRTLPDQDRVVVDGVNLRKKHMRPIITRKSLNSTTAATRAILLKQPFSTKRPTTFPRLTSSSRHSSPGDTRTRKSTFTWLVSSTAISTTSG